MPDKCEPEQRFDIKLAAFKEYVDLKIDALRAEYAKSELNYPTRHNLNTEMREYIKKDEVELKLADVSRQVKIILGFLVGLFMLFVGEYLSRR